jgi:hypothetical protein
LTLQGGGDPLGHNAGAEAAGGAVGHAPTEDELDLIGAADVEILADDVLEEDAAGDRLVEDLRERELGLEDRDVVAVAGLAVGGGEGVREAGEPLARQGLDARGREPVAERLGAARVGAGKEPIVERFEGDARAGELALQVLVPVETELAGIGEVGAEPPRCLPCARRGGR